MAQYIFNQGDDVLVEIPVLDATNTPVDLTTATDIIAVLYFNKVSQAKYSLNTKTGYGDLTIKAGVGNEHIVVLQLKRTETSTFGIGFLQANVLVELPDATLTDKRTEYTNPAYIQVLEGLTRTEDI